jgi:hypothetical protein
MRRIAARTIWMWLLFLQFLAWYLMIQQNMEHHDEDDKVVSKSLDILQSSQLEYTKPGVHPQNEKVHVRKSSVNKATTIPAAEQASKDSLSTKTKNQPNLFIHLGPSKTGTSTIQRESVYWQETLAVDKYYYLGKFGDVKYRSPAKIPILFNDDDCFRQASSDYKSNRTSHFRETLCWKDRIDGLDRHRVRKENIVLSYEAYSYRNMYKDRSSDFFQMLRVGFDGWNVTIIPTYRRYYEWYLSCLKELNRRNCLSGSSKEGKWSHEGGSACKNLWQPIQSMLKASHNNNNWPGTKAYTNLDKSIPYWRDGGFPISILNFHDHRHITCTFYCDIITDTRTMCQLCLKQRGTN